MDAAEARRELARLLPALGEPSLDPAGQAAQARLFEVLLGLVVRLSQQTPVAIVVEDLVGCRNSFMQLVGGTRGADRRADPAGAHGGDPR